MYIKVYCCSCCKHGLYKEEYMCMCMCICVCVCAHAYAYVLQGHLGFRQIKILRHSFHDSKTLPLSSARNMCLALINHSGLDVRPPGQITHGRSLTSIRTGHQEGSVAHILCDRNRLFTAYLPRNSSIKKSTFSIRSSAKSTTFSKIS